MILVVCMPASSLWLSSSVVPLYRWPRRVVALYLGPGGRPGFGPAFVDGITKRPTWAGRFKLGKNGDLLRPIPRRPDEGPAHGPAPGQGLAPAVGLGFGHSWPPPAARPLPPVAAGWP